MQNTKRIGKRLFAALICMALVVWSVVPSFNHTPSVFETIQDHLEMVESHGHSHGLEEDLSWAMHGHSHDVVDHDHNQAFLAPKRQVLRPSDFREPWLHIASATGPSRQFPIERPPRG